MKISRYLEGKIQRDFNKKKIIIVYGARQVGKTTLVKKIIEENGERATYYNCDLDEVRESFEKHNLEHLRSLVQKYEIIIIDEAQRAKNIGLTLKILIDNFPEKNFLVTGSSSFELANTVSEPLTGRFFSHTLFPIALTELSNTKNIIEMRESLEEQLIFGSYPEVITTTDRFDKQRIIENITDNYLFKDILRFGVVKDTGVLKKLLQAVALQIGNEVSLSELSRILEIDKNTVKKYLELCEKVFILFSLPPYFSNKRKAITKMKKYYFCDLGVRNALLRNFNSLDIRNDIGALWENFLIIERTKFNASRDFFPQSYFWRSYQGQEIDLLEEAGGEMSGFEFKYSKNYVSETIRKIFTEDLGGKKFTVINKENFGDFIGV
jgi:hypothetical protein